MKNWKWLLALLPLILVAVSVIGCARSSIRHDDTNNNQDTSTSSYGDSCVGSQSGKPGLV